MKHTRKERLQIYKDIRELLRDCVCDGFCNLYFAVIREERTILREDDLKELPELYKHKPKVMHDDKWWFPRSYNFRRLNIIEDVISSMENSPLGIWYRFVDWYSTNKRKVKSSTAKII